MINAAIWNVRGLNRRDHQVSVANLVSEHRLQFIGLLETRVSVGNVARVQRGLLLSGIGLWIIVCYGMIWTVSHTRFVTCRGWSVEILTRWWMLARDARSLWKRLDRLLVNDWWLGCWPNTYYMSLHARTLDHSPLVLRGDNSGQSIDMFRFDNYLTLSAEFIPSVQCIWQHHIVGTAMFTVTRKLRALKLVFRAQRQKRGDLSNNVKLAASFLEAVQQLLAQDRHSGVFLLLEFCCKLVLRLASRLEQNMLHQRAKIAWMKGGDQCSRVFFRKIAKRRASKRVYQITNSIADAGILDTLISPSQNAFVPGRSIGDNILLAQELFCGYNHQHLPPRCALKVDLRKAYDTVEWDFLRAVLILFGFPEQFIGWIVECVTTPSFSVCLNGSPHGYFKGARGLRQGDPMSPYLVVLVMEVLSLLLRQFIDQDGGFSYHWKCEAMQLCQLGFADDLLLFSKADTDRFMYSSVP
ncbi:UNVERIFIED_CONTAM: Retrovirus-related Pol polyprotein from type-2 retrotransposable element R2DM [Sesamum latifolium]|uniref:Retrovirus-related Pol polyprotein from type-2 retrotransposable element R2DM n=1 Tax=Sesamum latifolium TaxID=2727402 RepID=A0AAW2WEP3_9LAMI